MSNAILNDVVKGPVPDPYEIDVDENAEVSEKKGTEADQRDMHRMGKMQELRRNFRFVTIFGFTMVLMATWEAQLVSQ
jgi:hypothetical protein